MKYLFIINPVAGKGMARSYLPEIHNYFKDRAKDKYFVEITGYPGHATLLAANYSREDDFRIIAFGGDGTLNEVLNGMAGTGSSLGIVPTGSGNDFIKTMVPDRNYKDILRRTIEGEEILIDCGKAKDKYFINIMSVGIDSEIANYATIINQRIHLAGKASYLLGLLVAIVKKKLSFPLKMTLDGERTVEQNFLLAAITNGKYYGGGFIPVPYTDFRDGIFDLCMVEEKGVPFILKILPRYMKGTHLKVKGVVFEKARHILIESPREIRINLDGEVFFDTKVDIRVLPGHLKFLRPSVLA
jgi:YegS/Rv2252/BmrU family lipid kinase